MRSALSQFNGPPRSVIWGGGALHLRCGGALRQVPGLHAHFAIQLSAGILRELSLRCTPDDAERLAGGWLIRSDQPHWLQGSGPGVTIFWDPLSPNGRLVATRLAGTSIAALTASECAAIRGEFENCWERGWRLSDLREAAARIPRLVAPPDAAPAPIDRRIRAVVETLQLDPAQKSTLAELAQSIHLSESRLAHLFRRDVGIAMRQYRLALRAMQALQEIARGATFTQAAYRAGFADPAQFCRTCRRMFGSAPSRLPDLTSEF